MTTETTAVGSHRLGERLATRGETSAAEPPDGFLAAPPPQPASTISATTPLTVTADHGPTTFASRNVPRLRSADAERRHDPRCTRRRWRPHRRGRSRQAGCAARLRGAAARRSRAREERRRAERYGGGRPNDGAGATRFRKRRDEVDPERIGALGLSTGADVLIQVAGHGTELKSVVADGTYGVRSRTPSASWASRRSRRSWRSSSRPLQ